MHTIVSHVKSCIKSLPLWANMLLHTSIQVLLIVGFYLLWVFKSQCIQRLYVDGKDSSCMCNHISGDVIMVRFPQCNHTLHSGDRRRENIGCDKKV